MPNKYKKYILFIVQKYFLILTIWRPLNEPLVDSWMAAGNQSSGIEERMGVGHLSKRIREERILLPVASPLQVKGGRCFLEAHWRCFLGGGCFLRKNEVFLRVSRLVTGRGAWERTREHGFEGDSGVLLQRGEVPLVWISR